VDRQGTDRINPFNSLRDAERRRDLPGSTAQVAVAGFTDVAHGHAHETGITFVAEREITNGCAPRRYCPEASVTRAQMATFIQKAANLPDGGAHGFRDVAADHPHARGIAAVKAAGDRQRGDQRPLRPPGRRASRPDGDLPPQRPRPARLDALLPGRGRFLAARRAAIGAIADAEITDRLP
jgi:hypothetical protein